MVFIAVLIIALVSLVLVWLVSLLVEVLRQTPGTPDAMPWDPSLQPAYVAVHGVNLRYLKVGDGPTLVLLHTLRTQLDLFHKVIPELARDFTVYALDLPGHGYSDIPDGPYDAGFFVGYVEGFLEQLDLTDVTLSGVSIGASVSLIIAARGDPRVARIVPINLSDYDRGRGIARASWVGRVAVTLAPSDACDREGGPTNEDEGIEHVTPQLLGSFDCPGIWSPGSRSTIARAVGHARPGSSRFAR